MKRRAVIITGVATVALVVALLIAKRSSLATLTPSELAAKLPVPPVPHDDVCAPPLGGPPDEKPTRNANQLGADDVAIYRGILEHWNSKSPAPLNLSNRTSPIDRDLSNCSCLKGVEPQGILNAARSFHVLTEDVFSGQNVRLVDANKQAAIVRSNDPHNSMSRGKSVEPAVDRAFANGLFSVSEIAFDRDHRRAIVSYSFVCGSLCGSGGIWLFEKVDGAWRKSEHDCGGWIS